MIRLLFLLAVLLPAIARGQEKERIRIIKTDSLLGNTTPKGPLRRLIGRVELQTEKAYIKCDSAWHYPELRRVEAYGSIVVKSSKEELYAQQLVYDLKTESVTFSGPIEIRTKESRLFTTDGSYNLKAKTARFVKQVYIRDKKGDVTANRGFFYTERDSMRLFDRVQLRDSTLYLEADSLISGKKSGLTQAGGNVFIAHEKDRWSVRAGHFAGDTLGNRIFQQQVEYAKRDSASSDTTWMAAGWLHANEKEKQRTLSGKENIRIWNPDYAAAADSIYHDETSGVFRLRKKPLLWTDNRQLTAANVDMNLEKSTIKTLSAYPTPFMAEEDSISHQFHQITGDSLFTQFLDGNPHRMEWINNIKVLYHNRADTTKEPGLLFMQGTTLSILFENKKATHMKGSSDVTGYFSEKPGDSAAMRLPGFSWDSERRPPKPAALPAFKWHPSKLDSLKNRFIKEAP
jgi:hypothetical protein